MICVIENPDLTLVPGTNVNAEIKSQVVENALAIPKEAIRREGMQSGVFKLHDKRVVWQPVKLGIGSVSRAQVIEGLTEGDLVAMPVDRPLKANDSASAIPLIH